MNPTLKSDILEKNNYNMALQKIQYKGIEKIQALRYKTSALILQLSINYV